MTVIKKDSSYQRNKNCPHFTTSLCSATRTSCCALKSVGRTPSGRGLLAQVDAVLELKQETGFFSHPILLNAREARVALLPGNGLALIAILYQHHII